MRIPIPEFDERFKCKEDAIEHVIRICNVVINKSKCIFPKATVDNVPSYVLEFCNKVLQQVTTLIMVARERRDYNTVCSLVRNLADNVSVLRLIYGCDEEEERALRHLLYVLDGVSQRYRMLEERPMSYNGKIPRETYNALFMQVQGAKDNAAKCIQFCVDAIKVSPLYHHQHDNIDVLIKKTNWKYKTIDKPMQAYSWAEMYNLLEIKEGKDMFSYFSQYVHGLSISNIVLNDTDSFEVPLAYTFCLVVWIMSFLKNHYEPNFSGYTMEDIYKIAPELFNPLQ